MADDNPEKEAADEVFEERKQTREENVVDIFHRSQFLDCEFRPDPSPDASLDCSLDLGLGEVKNLPWQVGGTRATGQGTGD